MKNKWFIILALFIIVLIGVGIYFFSKNNNRNNNEANQNTYTANKTVADTKNNTINNSVSNSINSSTSKQNDINNITNENQVISTEISPKEEEISSFTTKIYSKDAARQNNISITCSTLNGTIVKAGETFSFCNTVGPASSSKGYQEADIFDKDGNKKKGLGGGNCQVSTTLYNAVLSVPPLVVTERHEHSNKVPYIETGKDAAVSYGSYDLKFRNDTGHDVKIKCEASNDNVKIILYKI